MCVFNTCIVLKRQTLLRTIKGPGMIHGLAVYEDQLFVLTCRPNKILVYNCTNFALTREISIDALESPQCMDICTSNACLYISDYVSRSVYKLPVSDERNMTSWRVSDKPRGISVNRNSNVLVIIERKQLIEEYTPTGELVRNIPHRQIARPWHCVQFNTGEYVVCHGSGSTDQHRVCLIDQTGCVIGVNGGLPGEEINQFNWPNYLALDSRNNIAVCDRKNKRIQLLDSSLTWFATIGQLPNGRGFSKLRALCIDDVRGRLYVGQFNGMVHVLTYSINPATWILNSTVAERICEFNLSRTISMLHVKLTWFWVAYWWHTVLTK